ncbi:hypothetical protein ACYKDZ_17720 [Stutzerimonas stutzeri]|jgi:hypothetical protein
MSKPGRLIYGVGVNDYPHPVSAEGIVNGCRKRVWRCDFYEAWTHMLARCYSQKLHENRPTYIGCTVAPEWHRFSVFREWMMAQEWQGMDLDKDVLCPGNKVYSSETCAFIPRKLNLFLSLKQSQRGQFPVGVLLNKAKDGFESQCHNPFTGKREHLGRFASAESAHEAWRSRKHEHACRFADMQKDPRVAHALRLRFAPGFVEQVEALKARGSR